MKGKLVDLKEAKHGYREIGQTKAVNDHIDNVGVRMRGFMTPLKGKDVTYEYSDLARQFMPELTLSGIELRAERMSKSWGGMYFRILENIERENSLVIQWLFMWIKIRFFISFWLTVVPLLFLSILSFLIFNFLSLESAAISIALVSGIFFIIGATQLRGAGRGESEGLSAFSNTQLFPIFAILFDVLIAEIYLSKSSAQSIELIEGAIAWHPRITENISLSWVGSLFVVLAVGFILLWRFFPHMTYPTNDIDWAPLFIYLTKDKESPNSDWTLDRVQYDRFKYATASINHSTLRRNQALINSKRPRFKIINFWHSFRPRKGRTDSFYFIGGILILLLGILLMGIAYYVGFSELTIPRKMNVVDVLIFLIAPFCVLLGLYFGFGNLPTRLIEKKIDLSDPKYHLTDFKLKIFWNLKGAKAALKVRSKFQNPFMHEEDFLTFLDDLEQIVSHVVLPKIYELESESRWDTR